MGEAPRNLHDPRDIDWRLVVFGWLVGLGALVLLLLSVTGNGTGPAGFAPLRSVLWVWVLILGFALAWLVLLRGLPWPSPMQRTSLGATESRSHNEPGSLERP